MPEHTVDPYRFIDFATRNVVKTWIRREHPHEIPWTRARVPLEAARVALISTAAIVKKTDQPWDIEGEQRNPWRGDPSYRIIPAGCGTEDLNVQHTHINTRYPKDDINCLFPLDRLQEEVEKGTIGTASPRHYSFMGYQIETTALMQETAPRIVANLIEDQVDLALLIPV